MNSPSSRTTRTPKCLSFVGAAFCAALGTMMIVAPATAQADWQSTSQAPRVVSAPLMDVLETWSSSDANLESLAFEEAPQAFGEYADSLRSVYQGRSLSEHIAQNYPEVHKSYLEDREMAFVEDEGDFLASVVADDVTYSKWQQEAALRGNKFSDYLSRNYPHLVDTIERDTTPAAQGVTLVDYLDQVVPKGELGEKLTRELDDLLGTITTDGDDCVCWTVASFPHQPDPWQAESTESHSDSWGWAPKKRQNYTFASQGRGAAKNFDFYRRSKHNTYLKSTSRTNYDAQMRVRMLCTESGTPGGANCQGSTCTGELAMRTAYSSRAYESVDVSGIWSKRSRMRVGDAASLYFDPPGPAPQTALFQKGVAVSGDVKTGWNAEAGLQLLQSAAQVALVIAGDGTSAATLLEGDLLDETYNAIIGLIEKSGSTGSNQVDMQVAFDTAGSAPFTLLPNTTLAFDLDTESEFWSRGYGGESKSWGNVDSSAYMVGVARNYQCAAGVTPPTGQSFWYGVASSNAPQTPTTVANLIRNWISVELGATPNNTSQQVGQFP